MYETLKVQQIYNLTLPAWTDSVYPHPLRSFLEMGFALFTHTNYMKLVKGGPLVTTIVNEMLQFQRENSSKNLYIYSGHDLTLVSVLRLLDLVNETSSLPEYGATLAFELHNTIVDDNSQVEFRVCTNLIISYH